MELSYLTPIIRCGRKVMKLIFYLSKFLFFFKYQCYLLQNIFLGQLHTNGDVPTFGSSAESSTGMVLSMSVTLMTKFFMKTSLKGSEKESFAWDQTLQMNASSRQRPLSNWPLHYRIFYLKSIPVVSQPPHLTSAPVTFSFFRKLKNIIKGHHPNIQKSVTNVLKTLFVEDFQHFYQKRENVSIGV